MKYKKLVEKLKMAQNCPNQKSIRNQSSRGRYDDVPVIV